MGQYITAKLLKEMVKTGNVEKIELVAVGQQRVALRAIVYGTNLENCTRLLRTTNGEQKARAWASLDRAARFVREELKITHIDIDMNGWNKSLEGG